MKVFSIFFALVLFAVVGRAEESAADTALQTMVANEAKFYEYGKENGTRAAFLEFLADDGVVFHPTPVNGKKEWTRRADAGPALTWKPLFAAMSSSADLGYTSGPAEWRTKKEDAKPFGYGQFITIWKKQKDGSFKVALDVGGEVPGLVKGDETPQLEMSIRQMPNEKIDRLVAEKSLRRATAQFALAAKADSTIGLSEASDQEIRVYREGVFPALGKGAVTLMLSVRRGHLTNERLGGEMSVAGDLAYSYGKYSLSKLQETEHGSYLQIWRIQPDGNWKIALDYQSPAPSAEPKK